MEFTSLENLSKDHLLELLVWVQGESVVSEAETLTLLAAEEN